MKESDLNNRIKQIGFWIFGFFFWYLVVSFFLKSGYPINQYTFNSKDAYEVVRDGLTLSAYFLAPAIAYVLFTDWRVQYKAIKDDNFYDEVESLLNKLYYRCEDIFLDMVARTVDPGNIMAKISRKVENFEMEFEELKTKFRSSNTGRNNDNEIFLNYSEDLIDFFELASDQITWLKADFSSLYNNRIKDQKEIECTEREFNNKKEKIDKSLDNIKNKLNDLSKNKPVL